MSLHEISREQFRRLAVSVVNTLPVTDVAWFTTSDECLVAVVFHDVLRHEWKYNVYCRKWGICEQVAEAGGFDGRPDAALVARVKSLAETVRC